MARIKRTWMCLSRVLDRVPLPSSYANRRNISGMAKHTYFITGTDTGVGKTIVSAAILEAAKSAGKRTLAMKPIASGCDQTPEG